jgi:homoserine dehydrogenase
MLGCGTVGEATARLLLDHAEDLAERAGAPIELARVAVRDPAKPRKVDLPVGVLTAHADQVVSDADVDLIVEVIGGVEPSRSLILQAIANGKPVVTANKELLSTAGEDVMKPADEAGVDLLFEGSVAGGIPIIRPMKESLAGDQVTRVMGIVNGTTNYILTRMSERGESFEQALAEADRRGYTEADASADIDGHDAAAKLAILASIAFNARVVVSDVVTEGISTVSHRDIVAAHDLGYEVKLVASAERDDGQITARVHPAMIPRTHPLASVRDVFNAIFVEGREVGELMFFGRGAGGGPTASAVVGDIVEVCRNLSSGARSPGCTCYRDRARIRSEHESPARYYIVLSVLDAPGVLSSIAGVFGRNGVSIASVRQEGFGDEATLVLVTHVSSEGRHAATFDELRGLDAVKSLDSRMRVLGTAER